MVGMMLNSKIIVVAVVHFSKWVDYNIIQRRLPDKVYGEVENTECPSVVECGGDGNYCCAQSNLFWSCVQSH